MGAVRKQFSFIITGILTAFLLAALCGGLVADCVSVLRNGWGTDSYIAAGANGSAVSVVKREANGGFRFISGTLDGKRTAERTASIPCSGDCTVAGIYPVSDGSVFLGMYEGKERAADSLNLYRVTPEGEVEHLLVHTCVGVDAAERMSDHFLSGFAEWEGSVRFMLVDAGVVHPYAYGSAGSGLIEYEPIPAVNITSAAMLSDGVLALGSEGTLTLNGKPAAFLPENCIVTQLTQIGAGFFFMDSTTLKVFYCDPAGTDCVEMFGLGTLAQNESWNSVSFTENGMALVLRGGHSLLLVDGRRETSLASLLYRTPLKSAFTLSAIILIWFVLSVTLWYVFSGRQHSYLPFAVRMGAMLAVLGLSAGVYLNLYIIRPMVKESISREVRNTIAGAAALIPGDSEGVQSVVGALAGLPGSEYGSSGAVTYIKNAGAWVVSEGGTVPARSRAVLSDGFLPYELERALSTGSAFANDSGIFRLYLGYNGKVTQFYVSGSALRARIEEESVRLAHGVWTGLLLLWIGAVCALLIEGRRVRRISAAMERLGGGEEDSRLNMRTGDEFESIAESFNSMVDALRNQRGDQSDLIRAYLRFVPESVLRLLGEESILNVDKHTFATHRMSAMMVWFGFPERVYDNSTRALFENINEVIERTAAIVVRKGGTVFNFAHNGYDVVLGGNEADAVSTAVAVQQEVLSLNEQRAMAGRPPVILRIALDVGEMMIGVVGDETQMEPVTISTSFTTARRLIELAGRLEAGILCTENIIKGAEGYGSRYMGKTGGHIRVYEIFDGDVFDVRRSKKNTGQRFAKGIFALYSRDVTAAKKIFLELVHENPGDGGARYYLYLADRLEKQPDQEINLECQGGIYDGDRSA